MTDNKLSYREAARRILRERGPMHYSFNEVRGTIIATSRCSRDTEGAALAAGAAPITLIDGDKLIAMLIEHGNCARKRTSETLKVEASAFSESDEDA